MKNALELDCLATNLQMTGDVFLAHGTPLHQCFIDQPVDPYSPQPSSAFFGPYLAIFRNYNRQVYSHLPAIAQRLARWFINRNRLVDNLSRLARLAQLLIYQLLHALGQHLRFRRRQVVALLQFDLNAIGYAFRL